MVALTVHAARPRVAAGIRPSRPPATSVLPPTHLYFCVGEAVALTIGIAASSHAEAHRIIDANYTPERGILITDG